MDINDPRYEKMCKEYIAKMMLVKDRFRTIKFLCDEFGNEIDEVGNIISPNTIVEDQFNHAPKFNVEFFIDNLEILKNLENMVRFMNIQ